jgi:diguanylate cyclase (GGDEF)-like protein
VEAIELITENGRPVLLTTSIGVAEYRPQTEILSDLMVRADQALYKAKSMGRNRFECFE